MSTDRPLYLYRISYHISITDISETKYLASHTTDFMGVAHLVQDFIGDKFDQNGFEIREIHMLGRLNDIFLGDLPSANIQP